MSYVTKELMITISAEHAFNILNGKKTLELRTWIPKGYMGWVNAYVTKNKPYLIRAENYDGGWINKNKGPYLLLETLVQNYHVEILNGKVAFRFWFDEYEYFDSSKYILMDNREFKNDYKGLCLTWNQFIEYGCPNNIQKKHGLVCRDLYVWYIKFLEVFDTPKELGGFYKKKFDDFFFIDGNHEARWWVKNRLTKAPKNIQWVYVKEEEDE